MDMNRDGYNREVKAGNKVRTVVARYGECILISDLQKILYKDAMKLARDGHEVASEYAESLAESLGNLKDA